MKEALNGASLPLAIVIVGSQFADKLEPAAFGVIGPSEGLAITCVAAFLVAAVRAVIGGSNNG